MRPVTSLEPVREYLTRIEAEVLSIRSAVIRERRGKYFKDLARITINSKGEVSAPSEYAPTDDEKKAISEAVVNTNVPVHIYPKDTSTLANYTPLTEYYECRDLDGSIIMVHSRLEKENGDKKYIPWTYWSDEVWRALEPEETLPLYNLPALLEHDVVFLHEGAKSVDGLLRQLEKGNHPWQDELTGAAHLGWVGGALNPYRTDWTRLNRAGVRRVYIVADNDVAGVSAIPSIAARLKTETWSLQFNNRWPTSWDLGDAFPETMFSRGIYTGPAFSAVKHPATFMTEKYTAEGSKKPSYRLRDWARDIWVWCEEADLYVLKSKPNVVLTEKTLNKVLSPYSHAANTTRIINREQAGRNVRLVYNPGSDRVLIDDGETSAINTYQPSPIRPIEGSVGPWEELLENLIPIEEERREAKRWIATLIARPGTRMVYSLLMASPVQGVGKTTIGQRILAPLIGMSNTSAPSEAEITSDYNDWISHKRLAVINEIYEGHSWKTYNRLKPAITDTRIRVNRKYVPQYEIDNWCHIFACSNSLQPLKIDTDDRRWYVPHIGEKLKSRKWWDGFYDWLDNGGLAKIAYWANSFGEYVLPGEHAPRSLSKDRMIKDSKAESLQIADEIGQHLDDKEEPTALSSVHVLDWIKQNVGPSRSYARPVDVIKELSSAGGNFVLEGRVRLGGRLHTIVCNRDFESQYKARDARKVREAVVEHIIRPEDLMEADF